MEKPKVLVIDDDPDLVESVRITLEANNYEVYSAGNGTEGLRLVKETHPDLIILDVMMDSITEGFQVSYQLRSRDPQSEYKEYSHIPIIMLTGISQKMHMKFSTEADEDFLPVDEFMDKPIRLEASGRTDSFHRALRNTFEGMPDAPITRVVLKLRGGKKGLLQNSKDICAKPYRAAVSFTAHNGAAYKATPKLGVRCRGQGKRRHRG